MRKEFKINIGKTFNGRNLKNMSLITTVSNPSETLDMKTVASRRIPIADYPLFTKEDPQEVLESYIVDFLSTCLTSVAYSFYELLDNALDVYSLKRKRKSKSTGDGPSGTSRTSEILKNL